MFGSGYSEACLASERDPKRAGTKRSLFSHAFSAKALNEQELVLQRCINSFIGKLGKLGNSPKGLNMVKWYEMVSFDILGEMAFGESFDCIEKGGSRTSSCSVLPWLIGRLESSHFWLDLILGHVLAITVFDNLRRFPLLLTLLKCVPSQKSFGIRDKVGEFSRDSVTK